MALFKCKMCGGDLNITDGMTVAECEYCNTKQPVPTKTDESQQNLFNRANALRINSEFDKAEKLYEKILESDTTQADAYWGLILCKYGIEYVDDPATKQKIPTCHRASYDSIIADEDYKAALEHADMIQRRLYEQEAKEIDRIQKDILALAQNEETYDVFICYKETDANGQRTRDSVIANEIYHQLTQEGFKVFYAAITLEGKLGSAYEPIIFAALNSAKVMLVIGTKPEYFNAVWVKNEWSRFLKIIKKDHSKMLIPCYRDMDAYHLPEEFSHLQAQDMSKIGFVNDLIRGIKKVVKKPVATATVKTTAPAAPEKAGTAPLLKRAYMFLEDGDWKSADEYCEKVLDLDPECAEAYVGKLMVELRVHKQEQLQNRDVPFNQSKYYQKAIQFGNPTLTSTLKQYNQAANERAEENRKLGIYQKASDLATGKTSDRQIAAALEFERIPGYRDASARAKDCRQKAIDISFDSAILFYNVARTSKDYYAAEKQFRAIRNYAPAQQKAEECHAKAIEAEQFEVMEKEMAEIARKDKVYAEAMADMQAGTTARLESAINKFSAIQSWKDSDKHLAACQKRLKAIREKARIEEEKAQKKSKRKAWIIRVIIILAVLLPFIIGALLMLIPIIIPIIGGILYGILIFVGGIVSIIFSLFESM